MDIASLSIEINTSDVAKAEADLDSFGATGKKSEESARGIGSAWKAALGSVAADLKTAVGELQALNARQEATARAVVGLGATFDGAAGSIRAAAEALSVQRVEAAKVEAASLGAAKGVDTLGSVSLQQSASVAQVSAKLNGLTAAADGVGESSMSAASGLAGLSPSATAAGAALGRVTESARIQSRELTDLIEKVDPITAAMKRLAEEQAQLGRFTMSGMLSGQQFTELSAKLEEQRAALLKSGDAMKLAGISAGQYSMAMRMLPMQLTDVVTSLASGMPVWQVAIQQGGQVRDSFGGIGNAARAVVSAIGPVGIGIGTAAAAVGTLGAAYLKGAAEAQAYEQALILTGNAAGTSSDALAAMALAMDNAGTTQAKAAAALAEVAGTGKFAESQIKAISEAAIAMEESTGKAVSSTVKEFSALADSPAAASAKLNQQYNYLTESVYKQIRALEDQGRKSDAAKLATDTYAEAMRTRAEQIDGNLGTLQRAWRSVTSTASEAWDAMLGIGREKTLEQQLGDIEGKLENLAKNPYADSIFGSRDAKAKLEQKRTELQLSIQQRDQEAAWQAEQAKYNQDQISADEKARKAKEDLNKTYQDGITSLKEETALLGDNSKEAAVRYAIEYGALKELTDEQKRGYIAAAAAYDAKESGIQASKDQAAASKKATEEQKREASSLQQLLDSLLPADAASRKYSETLSALDNGLIAGSLSLDTYQSAVESAWQALNKVDWDKQNQQIKEANDQFKSLRDRLDPAAAAAEQYAKDQDFLNQRFAQGNMSVEEYARLLGLLDQEYQQNSASSSQWAQFTERQLDRVDQAFSDAWLNIGHGFDSFASSLKRAFEQMLAELAHMAITRPIMLQIGSALGIGSSTQALASGSSGIWGGISSGLSTAGSGLSLYNGASGLLGAGVATADTSAVGASIAGYTSPQYASWVAGQSGIGSIGSALSAWAAPVSAALGLIKGFSSYLDGQRVDAKSSRGSVAAWATGYQPLAELNGAINKLTKMVGLDGTILGGIINAPGMILQGIGNALFGSWKIKDYGIALGVNDGELNPQSYVYKKKKGLLTGTKKKTSYDPLTGDSAQQLQEAFATTEDGVASIFEQLGYVIDDGAYAGLQIARAKISTKGKTEDEVSKAVQDWFTQAGESINSYLNATLGTGLSYDIAGMTTFVNDLYAVNGLLDHLNVGLFTTNVAGGRLVEQLLGLTGGLEALTSSVATYYDQFFTDAEKQANTLADVTQVFAAASQTLPATRAEYRAMVESIDLTTEAGRNMFATLMNLAGQADSYYDIVEQRAAAAQAAIAQRAADFANSTLGAAKGALSTLSSAIGAEQQRLSDAYNARVASINDMLGTANGAVSSLTAVGSSLDAALKQLSGSSEQATALLHEQAVATLRSALAFAKAGGSLAGFAGLQDALDSATNISSGRYSTLEDLQREQGRTANLIAQLQGVNGTQLTTEQRILDSLQGQLDQAKADYDLQTSGLDAQLTAAQAQLDALLGIDSGVKSVADALALFAGSMQQAQALQNANSSITSVTGLAGVKRQVASDGTILDEHGQSMGLKVVGNQVVGTQSWNQDWLFNLGQDGQMSWAAGQQANIQEWAKSQGIPGFAAGGDFGGGLRLVGEHGPELEVTGPSRIFNARQTADLLGGGAATAQEIRNLRADMGQVFDALRAIAKHTMQTSKYTRFLEQFEADGMPAVRA